MNDKLFDKRLKNALDHIEAPYDPASWAALEQRLNAPFAEEHPAPVHTVDKAVFHALERLEAPYQPAHWEMFANRMAEVTRLRRRVWISKLSEAAIFLLLLANLDGFLGESSKSEPVTPEIPAVNRLQAEAPNLRQGNHNNRSKANETAYQDDLASTFQVPGSIVSNYTQIFENQNTGEIIALNLSDHNLPLAPAILLNPTETPTEEIWAALASVAQLPVLNGQPVALVNRKPGALATIPVKTPKTSRFYAATFASFDQNYTKTEGYAHTANGYGGGMAIGYRIGKWGIEAGLSYNRKRYQPKKEIEIYDGNTVNGFYGSFAKQVDADIVSVPVKITRRIAQFGQTSVHAVAGATTNIALDKSYQYGSVFYPGQSPSSNPDPNQQPQLRKNGQGLLEKGALQGNTFISTDAGVRLEHPIGRRFVAFVEPAYRHAVSGKGIGPKPSKINTFSVQAGVLATL